jgi:hypothetical protein
MSRALYRRLHRCELPEWSDRLFGMTSIEQLLRRLQRWGLG